jgi:hypothetical protein
MCCFCAASIRDNTYPAAVERPKLTANELAILSDKTGLRELEI